MNEQSSGSEPKWTDISQQNVHESDKTAPPKLFPNPVSPQLATVRGHKFDPSEIYPDVTHNMTSESAEVNHAAKLSAESDDIQHPQRLASTIPALRAYAILAILAGLGIIVLAFHALKRAEGFWPLLLTVALVPILAGVYLLLARNSSTVAFVLKLCLVFQCLNILGALAHPVSFIIAISLLVFTYSVYRRIPKLQIALKKRIAIVAIMLFGPGALFVSIYVGSALVRNITAEHKLISSRQKAEKSADKKFEDMTFILKEQGIASSSVGSSKVDVCYINHDDRGWMVAGWYQDCYLRYVEGFTTDLTRVEVGKLLRTGTKGDSLFGTATLGGVCEMYEEEYAPTFIYRPAGVSDEEYNCRVPSVAQGLMTVRGPIMQDRNLSVKTYRSFDANKVDNSKNQVWITTEEHYYHEEIGCQIGLFCGNSRGTPVHPDI